MLSRGKLVQDWRQRLAAAENEAEEGNRLRWLYRMRVRLYRFLLSCYRDVDWRADEPSPGLSDETLFDASHGDTTTIVDVPLDGKPAKTIGKMRAVLKSVSAAQDLPPEAGPLTKGIEVDDWVVAVSPRDKLQMHGCQELLKRAGIKSAWGEQGELKVRHFDLARAVEIIRHYRPALRVKRRQWIYPQVTVTSHITSWPIHLAILVFFLAPVFAIWGALFLQLFLAITQGSLMEKEWVAVWLAVFYVAIVVFGSLMKALQDHEWKKQQRRDVQRLVEEDGIADNQGEDKS